MHLLRPHQAAPRQAFRSAEVGREQAGLSERLALTPSACTALSWSPGSGPSVLLDLGWQGGSRRLGERHVALS